MNQEQSSWHGSCDLRFLKRSLNQNLSSYTTHQGSCQAPLKLMRSSLKSDGRCELPILHTAGGLVGGDHLSVKVIAEEGTRCLLTNVAAQKVYGSVGRLKSHPEGQWSTQACHFDIHEDSDLEWMPQEVIVFEDGLFEQQMYVDLSPTSSFLSVEVVRLGRTASGEKLGSGCWRSGLEICRKLPKGKNWEFVDRLELGGDALTSEHGMAKQPVFGSFVWVAPQSLSHEDINNLLIACREARDGLDGWMSCSPISQGISARYLGSSTQAARFWFFRIWRHIRKFRRLSNPELPRVWPMQENPFGEKYSNKTVKEPTTCQNEIE